MNSPVDLYSNTYKHHSENLYQEIRKETYGEEIGQSSWITADEYRSFFKMLNIRSGNEVLEIATGSGGPAIFMVKETDCNVTGMDINENGVKNANIIAVQSHVCEKVRFLFGDASKPLPLLNESFDVVVSMDSMNHINHRANVLKEFYRVLKKGGKILYTDTTVVTGAVTFEELAIRSSIGFFLFLPLGENERLIKEAGFQKIESKDVTENMAMVSLKWHNAREKRKDQLLTIEGNNTYEGLQKFLKTVHILASEKRLSRILFIAEK